jgi:hypothetical protein
LDYIRSYFKTTGFLFSNDSQVDILSGKDEALNAWISANYIENNFDLVFVLFDSLQTLNKIKLHKN